jgi:hypothetical protein
MQPFSTVYQMTSPHPPQKSVFIYLVGFKRRISEIQQCIWPRMSHWTKYRIGSLTRKKTEGLQWGMCRWEMRGRKCSSKQHGQRLGNTRGSNCWADGRCQETCDRLPPSWQGREGSGGSVNLHIVIREGPGVMFVSGEANIHLPLIYFWRH